MRRRWYNAVPVEEDPRVDSPPSEKPSNAFPELGHRSTEQQSVELVAEISMSEER